MCKRYIVSPLSASRGPATFNYGRYSRVRPSSQSSEPTSSMRACGRYSSHDRGYFTMSTQRETELFRLSLLYNVAPKRATFLIEAERPRRLLSAEKNGFSFAVAKYQTSRKFRSENRECSVRSCRSTLSLDDTRHFPRQPERCIHISATMAEYFVAQGHVDRASTRVGLNFCYTLSIKLCGAAANFSRFTAAQRGGAKRDTVSLIAA